MSGRGRGGRGGVNKSFNREQLSLLGVAGNELVPGPVTQPPPLYPPLERKPVPLEFMSDLEYKLLLRHSFVEHMQLAPTYLKMPESKGTGLEQAIDKLVAQLPNAKEKFDWRLFPSELRPKVAVNRVKKIVKKVDVDERLNLLEKLEEKTEGNTEVVVKTEVNENEIDSEADIQEDEEDEEMDDGTDYANNYFDNGENYEDEDDNLEDGPVY